MGKNTHTLSDASTGSVFTSPKILEKYSTDGSGLTITPEFVVFPKSTTEVQNLVRFVASAKKDIPTLSITPRGSGTNEVGSAITSSIILSTERLDNLLDIDKRERLIRVQPGITVKELKKILAVHGLVFPIYGHDSSTIGGLISTDPADASPVKDGSILPYLRQLEVVLPSGDIIKTRKLSSRTLTRKLKSRTPESKLYRSLSALTKEHDTTINHISRDFITRAGYPNITQYRQGSTTSLTPLFVGAEGTLGIITEVVLRVSLASTTKKRLVARFSRLHEAGKFLTTISALHPTRLDIYDTRLFRDPIMIPSPLKTLIDSDDQHFMIFAEFTGHTAQVSQKINKISPTLPTSSSLLFETRSNKSTFDKLQAFLIATTEQHYVATPPLFRNIYLPSWNLSSFINDLALIEHALKVTAPLCGSIATGAYHLFPVFSALHSPRTPDKFTQIVNTCIDRQGGSIAGVSPVGRTKAFYASSTLTPEVEELYRTIKFIFDPDNLMNPYVNLLLPPASDFSTNPAKTA